MAINSDAVQRAHGHADDIACILGGQGEFFPGRIAVECLADRMRRRPDKYADVPAVLAFASELLSCAGGVLAQGLLHGHFGGNT